jgi:hypothetical protein
MRRMRRKIFGTWRGALTQRWDERYIYIYIYIYVCIVGGLDCVDADCCVAQVGCFIYGSL